MELFDKKGCLTDEGLRALTENQLNELQRLEAAEHLSYCNRCLKRYTTLLTGEDALQDPPRDLAGPVRRSLLARMMHTVWGRSVVAAAAVVLAFGMWQTGLLHSSLWQPDSALPTAVSNNFVQAGDELSRLFGSLDQNLSRLFAPSTFTQEEDHSHVSKK